MTFLTFFATAFILSAILVEFFATQLKTSLALSVAFTIMSTSFAIIYFFDLKVFFFFCAFASELRLINNQSIISFGCSMNSWCVRQYLSRNNNSTISKSPSISRRRMVPVLAVPVNIPYIIRNCSSAYFGKSFFATRWL